jgi:hypothetical protein
MQQAARGGLVPCRDVAEGCSVHPTHVAGCMPGEMLRDNVLSTLAW